MIGVGMLMQSKIKSVGEYHGLVLFSYPQFMLLTLSETMLKIKAQQFSFTANVENKDRFLPIHFPERLLL